MLSSSRKSSLGRYESLPIDRTTTNQFSRSAVNKWIFSFAPDALAAMMRSRVSARMIFTASYNFRSTVFSRSVNFDCIS